MTIYDLFVIGTGVAGTAIANKCAGAGSDLILGAHIIGPNADETINLFALAMKTGMKARDLKTMPFIFPSSSSDIPHML